MANPKFNFVAHNVFMIYVQSQVVKVIHPPNSFRFFVRFGSFSQTRVLLTPLTAPTTRLEPRIDGIIPRETNRTRFDCEG